MFRGFLQTLASGVSAVLGVRSSETASNVDDIQEFEHVEDTEENDVTSDFTVGEEAFILDHHNTSGTCVDHVDTKRRKLIHTSESSTWVQLETDENNSAVWENIESEDAGPSGNAECGPSRTRNSGGQDTSGFEEIQVSGQPSDDSPSKDADTSSSIEIIPSERASEMIGSFYDITQSMIDRADPKTTCMEFNGDVQADVHAEDVEFVDAFDNFESNKVGVEDVTESKESQRKMKEDERSDIFKEVQERVDVCDKEGQEKKNQKEQQQSVSTGKKNNDAEKDRFEPLQQEEGEHYLAFVHRKTAAGQLIYPKKMIYKLGYLNDVKTPQLEEVLKAQYKIAVEKRYTDWIKDCRYHGEILFSKRWLDENIPPLGKKGKQKDWKREKKRSSRTTEWTSAHGEMCQDFRLEKDPSIPVMRENAASKGNSDDVTDRLKNDEKNEEALPVTDYVEDVTRTVTIKEDASKTTKSVSDIAHKGKTCDPNIAVKSMEGLNNTGKADTKQVNSDKEEIGNVKDLATFGRKELKIPGEDDTEKIQKSKMSDKTKLQKEKVVIQEDKVEKNQVTDRKEKHVEDVKCLQNDDENRKKDIDDKLREVKVSDRSEENGSFKSEEKAIYKSKEEGLNKSDKRDGDNYKDEISDEKSEEEGNGNSKDGDSKEENIEDNERIEREEKERAEQNQIYENNLWDQATDGWIKATRKGKKSREHRVSGREGNEDDVLHPVTTVENIIPNKDSILLESKEKVHVTKYAGADELKSLDPKIDTEDVEAVHTREMDASCAGSTPRTFESRLAGQLGSPSSYAFAVSGSDGPCESKRQLEMRNAGKYTLKEDEQFTIGKMNGKNGRNGIDCNGEKQLSHSGQSSERVKMSSDGKGTEETWLDYSDNKDTTNSLNERDSRSGDLSSITWNGDNTSDLLQVESVKEIVQPSQTLTVEDSAIVSAGGEGYVEKLKQSCDNTNQEVLCFTTSGTNPAEDHLPNTVGAGSPQEYISLLQHVLPNVTSLSEMKLDTIPSEQSDTAPDFIKTDSRLSRQEMQGSVDVSELSLAENVVIDEEGIMLDEAPVQHDVDNISCSLGDETLLSPGIICTSEMHNYGQQRPAVGRGKEKEEVVDEKKKAYPSVQGRNKETHSLSTKTKSMGSQGKPGGSFENKFGQKKSGTSVDKESSRNLETKERKSSQKASSKVTKEKEVQEDQIGSRVRNRSSGSRTDIGTKSFHSKDRYREKSEKSASPLSNIRVETVKMSQTKSLTSPKTKVKDRFEKHSVDSCKKALKEGNKDSKRANDASSVNIDNRNSVEDLGKKEDVINVKRNRDSKSVVNDVWRNADGTSAIDIKDSKGYRGSKCEASDVKENKDGKCKVDDTKRSKTNRSALDDVKSLRCGADVKRSNNIDGSKKGSKVDNSIKEDDRSTVVDVEENLDSRKALDDVKGSKSVAADVKGSKRTAGEVKGCKSKACDVKESESVLGDVMGSKSTAGGISESKSTASGISESKRAASEVKGGKNTTADAKGRKHIEGSKERTAVNSCIKENDKTTEGEVKGNKDSKNAPENVERNKGDGIEGHTDNKSTANDVTGKQNTAKSVKGSRSTANDSNKFESTATEIRDCQRGAGQVVGNKDNKSAASEIKGIKSAVGDVKGCNTVKDTLKEMMLGDGDLKTKKENFKDKSDNCTAKVPKERTTIKECFVRLEMMNNKNENLTVKSETERKDEMSNTETAEKKLPEFPLVLDSKLDRKNQETPLNVSSLTELINPVHTGSTMSHCQRGKFGRFGRKKSVSESELDTLLQKVRRKSMDVSVRRESLSASFGKSLKDLKHHPYIMKMCEASGLHKRRGSLLYTLEQDAQLNLYDVKTAKDLATKRKSMEKKLEKTIDVRNIQECSSQYELGIKKEQRAPEVADVSCPHQATVSVQSKEISSTTETPSNKMKDVNSNDLESKAVCGMDELLRSSKVPGGGGEDNGMAETSSKGAMKHKAIPKIKGTAISGSGKARTTNVKASKKHQWRQSKK